MSTIKPVRLQLRRVARFNLQELSRATNGLPAVNCARPGPYGNPFVVGPDLSAEHAVIHFRADLLRNGWVIGKRRTVLWGEIRDRLAGKNLACFCELSAKHCHVDVYLQCVNDPAFIPEVMRHGH